ncbi:alpha/beta-hydrolase [Dichomitus squalens]|nr:alpha/beta-hydrolase [Dichomitus squalens]
MGQSGPLLRRQPFKGLYIAYLVGSTVLIRLPYWCLRYALPYMRPRSSWSLRRCVTVATYREVLTGVPLKLGLDNSHPPPASDNELKDAKFVRIEGLSEDSVEFCGELRRAARRTGIRPETISAYWFLRPGTDITRDLQATAGEKVAMHIHGGAFYLNSAHPDDATSQLSLGLLAHSHSLSRVLGVDYRLSATAPNPPKNAYPAALLDCVAAYRYLVKELGFAPENITIVGDSAGGNLAVATTRHLVENSIPGLPPPGRLLLCSPWLDIAGSRGGPSDPRVCNRYSDILGGLSDYPHRAYLGTLIDAGDKKTNPYISPASGYITETEGLFKGFPRTYISAGGAELILDDSIVAAERMEADGMDVVLNVEPDAVHDYMIFTWMEPERTEGLKKASKWLDS